MHPHGSAKKVHESNNPCTPQKIGIAKVAESRMNIDLILSQPT